MVTKQQLSIFFFTGLLLWGALLVVGPFLPALGWAGILALVTWPLYCKVKARLGLDSIWAASLMTGFLFLVVFVPTVGASLVLARNTLTIYQSLQTDGSLTLDSLVTGTIDTLSAFVGQIPGVGSGLASWLQGLDNGVLEQALRERVGQLLTLLGSFGREVGQSVVTLFLTLFTIFFLYLDGEVLVAQIERGLDRSGGKSLTSLLIPLAQTIRAVMLGLGVTAIAQGVLAGIGIAVAGISIAPILAFLTFLLSVVQIPTFIVWFPCVVWLLMQGKLLAAGLLFIWGLGVVSTIDNVLKPYFISQGTGIPFLLVFFGVLGGLLVFGTLGLVLGPVILSLLLVLWRRWVMLEEAPVPASEESS
ncbi:AI-2E family transporter [Anthocerotibacter panamensis]|uniref:AI-2E family transporter n=1 Tax=Anthocerotibacter panamensis TaxID=2857077 RepID=UPI001C403A7B|nr:AI-2E family transporter [Anthocerotibacter panamensis]